MVIVFGNQKGGAGKSTLAILFANILSVAKKKDVIVLDMDYQRTIFSRYKEAELLENEDLYEVLELDLDKYPQILEELKKNPDQIVIIDLPGKLDDDELIPILLSADVFIIPFHYDRNTFNSTSTFNIVTNALNPDAKKFFIPNRLKTGVRHETERDVIEEFSKYGVVTEKIPDSVAFQRITTYDISPKIIPLIEKPFDQIFKEIL
ncbi:ParA family protein [Sphingobacterium sp.]|uniref:ParA family protein n=1 Tax=Sphingobacterium sp. TaxID=341027 RepID=UPI0028AEB323|nr:ParA family protein [Sphingobacterium sp.]